MAALMRIARYLKTRYPLRENVIFFKKFLH